MKSLALYEERVIEVSFSVMLFYCNGIGLQWFKCCLAGDMMEETIRCFGLWEMILQGFLYFSEKMLGK